MGLEVEYHTGEKNYGFIIDNRKCIGCHACSVACKSENEVPLGVNRTWVKYVETGVFPNSRRHFQVTRCNHCANPPCVRICPTEAMYQRHDGIVEFDGSVCIGCKACMQACPYDAIYIDPDTDTAAKCHYCAHRVDMGLEPACVVVCPEHAIISGDMNNPESEISQLLARQDVTVRKPEQGTAPNLFYIDGNEAALHPTATERTPETFMWADVIPLHDGDARVNGHGSNGHGRQVPPPTRSRNLKGAADRKAATLIKEPQTQGRPWGGPIQFGARMAEQMVQVSYNAQHKIPWHWPVPAYLVTKGIGAGLFMLLAVAALLGVAPVEGPLAIAGGFTTLLFIGVTTLLLVVDLEKPERFLYILRRPQWRSWLTRGAVVLIGFSAVAGLWWLAETLGYLDLLAASTVEGLRPLFFWLGLPFALMAAIYTAFLFAQAEGRDLWQSPLLPFHLVVQSAVLGSGALLALDLFFVVDPALFDLALIVFAVSLVLDLFVTLLGEFYMPHASEIAARAAHNISHGAYRNHFWLGSIGLGHVLPLGLLLIGLFAAGLQLPLAAAGALAAVIGMYLYEYAFVMAPQDIQNS